MREKLKGSKLWLVHFKYHVVASGMDLEGSRDPQKDFEQGSVCGTIGSLILAVCAC